MFGAQKRKLQEHIINTLHQNGYMHPAEMRIFCNEAINTYQQEAKQRMQEILKEVKE